MFGLTEERERTSFLPLSLFSFSLFHLCMNSTSLIDTSVAQAQQAQQLAQKHVEDTAGTTVHTFDPDMTPEQKREQAEKQVPAEMLPSKTLNKQEPGALPTDVPTVDAEKIRLTVAGAEKKPTAQTTVTATKETPGAFTKIPNYYRSGWTAFSTLENPGGSIQLRAAEIPEDPFGDQLKESWYGEWWHNAGVLFFTGFFTWLLIKMGGGLASVMVVCAFLGVLYALAVMCFIPYLLLQILTPIFI